MFSCTCWNVRKTAKEETKEATCKDVNKRMQMIVQDDFDESSDSVWIYPNVVDDEQAVKFESNYRSGGLFLNDNGDSLSKYYPSIREISDNLDDYINERRNAPAPYIPTKNANILSSRMLNTKTAYGSISSTTVFSDWCELFDGWDNMYLTMRTNTITEITDNETAQEISSSGCCNEPKKIILPPGQVMGMFLCKKNHRAKILNLNWSIDKVVNLLLIKENGVKLPVSFSKIELERPRVISERQMAMSLRQNLGSHFDPKIQGLTFAIGSVNSKICYKMTVCKLIDIEKMISTLC
jgi:hypothetical protein